MFQKQASISVYNFFFRTNSIKFIGNMSCEVNFRKKGLFDVSFKFHVNFDDVISILQISLDLIIAFKFSCTPKLVTAVSMDIKLGTFPKFHWFYHNHAISILQTSFISFNQSCCLNLMTIVLTP